MAVTEDASALFHDGDDDSSLILIETCDLRFKFECAKAAACWAASKTATHL
jgi:hypothetical protein